MTSPGSNASSSVEVTIRTASIVIPIAAVQVAKFAEVCCHHLIHCTYSPRLISLWLITRNSGESFVTGSSALRTLSSLPSKEKKTNFLRTFKSRLRGLQGMLKVFGIRKNYIIDRLKVPWTQFTRNCKFIHPHRRVPGSNSELTGSASDIILKWQSDSKIVSPLLTGQSNCFRSRRIPISNQSFITDR